MSCDLRFSSFSARLMPVDDMTTDVSASASCAKPAVSAFLSKTKSLGGLIFKVILSHKLALFS
jgi:hypothetical protein